MRAYGKYFKNAWTSMQQVCVHVAFLFWISTLNFAVLSVGAELVHEGRDGASIS